MSKIKALASVLLEQGLSADTRRVRRERLTYLNAFKLRRLERAMQEVERRPVAGSFIEFGVALGGSAILLARHATVHGRPFHGFDVFATIPPPTSDKDDEKSKRRYEVIQSGASTGIGGDEYYGYKPNLFDEVCASFARHGVTVDGNEVQLHKGLFEETWPIAGLTSAALVHIDCDWYEPVAFCLDAVADILSPGGIMIIDDYNDYGGARAAVDEFLQKRCDFSLETGANPFLRKLAA
jgi:asparagine synthase (glutamine-hydrolysing)